MPKAKRLPPFDDSKDQMCSACTWIGEMFVTAHEAGCDGFPRCSGVSWSLLQQPHMAKRCPRCLFNWVEGRI